MHEAIDYRGLGTRSGDLEDPLPDRKLMRDRGRPNRRVVDRDVAHCEGGEASVEKFAFHQSRCTSMLGVVVGKEEVADAEAAGTEVGAPGDLAEEPEGEVHRDAATVADALGGHTAAVRDRAECFAALDQDIVGLHAVLARDEPDPATALVICGVVQTDDGRAHCSNLLPVLVARRLFDRADTTACIPSGQGVAASMKRHPNGIRLLSRGLP